MSAREYVQAMKQLFMLALYVCAVIGAFTLIVRAVDSVVGFVRMRKLRELARFYAENPSVHPAVERKFARSDDDIVTQEEPTFALRPCSDAELVEPLTR